MLNNFFHDQLNLGIAQAVMATIFALLVLLITKWQSLKMEKEIFISIIRGLVQIVAVGMVLVAVLSGPLLLGIVVLLLMVLFAALIAARRSKNLPGSFTISLTGIFLGSGSVILLMTILGVMEKELTSLIPVGSMIIANAMNASALALDRFESEIRAHVGQIEAGLSLGASAGQVVQVYVQDSFRASLIPTINSMRSLGIVWIPGLMAGMILAGIDPIYSALYQFVVVGMLFVASSLAALTCTLLIRRNVFSQADQLLLKPEDAPTGK